MLLGFWELGLFCAERGDLSSALDRRRGNSISIERAEEDRRQKIEYGLAMNSRGAGMWAAFRLWFAWTLILITSYCYCVRCALYHIRCLVSSEIFVLTTDWTD